MQHQSLDHLTDRGYRLVMFADFPALRRALLEGRGTDATALVLMSDLATNCQAALAWRGFFPSAALVAQHTDTGSAEPPALLSTGVDAIIRPGDPPSLLASVLHALAYRQVRFAPGVKPDPLAPSLSISSPDHHRIGPWSLCEGGWLLAYRDVPPMRLTVSERALLVCVFEAPGHVASHAQMLEAVLRVWQPRPRARLHDPKCRTIISRLRQRARRARLPAPPLESLRDFGYAWVL